MFADLDQREHYAEIIDVVAFVTAQKQNVARSDEQLVNRTIQRATRDQEWLVYPMDPMPDGLGYSARLTMNKHLGVKSYHKKRDK